MVLPGNTSGKPDRRFLRYVLELALEEVRMARKDYLGTPQLFVALTKLDGGCTQDAIQRMGFSPTQVADTFRLALGFGKAVADTPIMPTRRCKEMLQLAEHNASGSTLIDERAIAQALLSERGGVMYEILNKLGIAPARLIEQILFSNVRSPLELAPPVAASSDADTAPIAEIVPSNAPTHNSRALKEHQQQLTAALARITLPAGITIRAWTAADFPAIQRISSDEGWSSPTQRPAEALLAWQNSWPALVAVADEEVVGFVCGLTDGAITTYISTLTVDARRRGHGIGRALVDVCHALYPTTRLDLLAVDDACAFYEACGFRVAYNGMRKTPRNG